MKCFVISMSQNAATDGFSAKFCQNYYMEKGELVRPQVQTSFSKLVLQMKKSVSI